MQTTQPTCQTGPSSAKAEYTVQPSVDLFETETEFVLTVELPGVSPQSVDVAVENNVLTIRGRAASILPEGYSPTAGRWGEKVFERSFKLSRDLDRDRFDAQLLDGRLTLKLPKAPQVLKQSIPVRS